jgi:hypothetical protein
MNRGARLWERIMMAKGLIYAAPIIVAHPLALPIVIPLLLNAKCEALGLALVAQGLTWGTKLVVGLFEQIINGPDEMRAQKMEQQGSPYRGPQPDPKPSPIDRLIALGNTFNKAGQPGTQPQADPYNLNGTVIWGQQTSAPQPGNGQSYEEPFQVPSEDTVRVGSSGRESGWQHNHHVGSAPPHPSHGHGGGG